MAALVLLGSAPAFAQDESTPPPMPLPLPGFHAPVDDDTASGASVSPAAAAAVPAGASQPAPPAKVPPPEPAAPAGPPQPVKLTALINDGGQPISAGLAWRVYDSKPDVSGKLVLAAKSNDAVAHVTLAPGAYMVDVAFGQAQASDTLNVTTGDNSKSIVLNAGGLRLNAAITGDIPIPINELHFDIFTPGPSDADREVVEQNLAANDILTLNAGTYHVVSYFGDVNAVVRADLKVEAGQLTDATLYHRAAQISFKLVSETGGEAIADVDWTVRSKDGTIVFTNTGTFPSAVLQEGDYTVFAKRGDAVYNRDFEVQPSQPKDVEVLTTVYASSQAGG